MRGRTMSKKHPKSPPHMGVLSAVVILIGFLAFTKRGVGINPNRKVVQCDNQCQ
jgi:hypothetical protein